MRLACVIALALLSAAALLSASGTSAQSLPLAFEVASIRENKIGGPGKKLSDPPTPVGTGGVMTPQGNQWAARNATLRTLIRFAYGSDDDLSTPPLLEEYRVVGGPDQVPCGVRTGFQGIMGNGASMTHLAAALSPLLGLMVVDRTTLPGTFDFDLRFTDDLTADARFPSIFTAVQEQLGLKLESTRAPVEVFVIDHVERPTEN